MLLIETCCSVTLAIASRLNKISANIELDGYSGIAEANIKPTEATYTYVESSTAQSELELVKTLMSKEIISVPLMTEVAHGLKTL